MLHVTGLETFELLPADAVVSFVVTEASIISANLAYIACIALVSPLFTSIASMLATPVTDVIDAFLYDTAFPPLKIAGTVGVVAGFLCMQVPESALPRCPWQKKPPPA